jgi:branched-chain amino acid transport system permease protein
MAGAAATWVWGPSQQPVVLPAFLHRQINVLGIDLGAYRLFLIVFVLAVTAALGLLVARTRFGAQVRAAVDNRKAAAGVGVNVSLLFTVTFALGSGLAGLGGALAIDVLGLDSGFATKILVYVLLVVVVGGAGSFKGSLVAALLLGVCDVAGKYYVPQIGGFIIYASMVVLLILFPAGLYGRRSS